MTRIAALLPSAKRPYETGAFVKAPSMRFGRDAIFERNDRFEHLAPREQKKATQLKAYLSREFQKCSYLKAVRKIENLSRFLYDKAGRIRGREALPLAVDAARKQYELVMHSAKATPIQRGLAGIVLANAEIAADDAPQEAFALLMNSFRQLKKAGFQPDPQNLPPGYLHGLYNRATFFLNNDLYRESAYHMGPEKTRYQDVAHEGLALMVDDMALSDTAVRELFEGLPYIEKAIELAAGVDDDKIALVEYLSAKGEMLHMLSHLDNAGEPERWDREGLTAFRKAFETLQTVAPENSTPRHQKLGEKLGTIKIPHMCSHNHRPKGATPECRALDNGARTYLDALHLKGIFPPPETPDEMFARQVDQGHMAIADDEPPGLDWLLRKLFGG